LPVVFTGGSSALVEEATGEADILDRHLGELGLPQGRVRFERSSRNTFENARFTAAMLRPKAGERYLLVTSAFHTPRAMALFRSAGFEAVACPVDYRTADSSDFWQPFVRAVDGLRRTDVAVREWAGLAVARLLGHTDSLFPGP
jgi:uncharacterized SAM-binding protein YcdF (DUF218 family)